ncbi:hypothetical protein [Opitutus terrae]|uniref:Uncharacterized protein n=1 Tax=Opitutus terrae (strain DSM 11246 / JCM 15787 / PB90-1) TaxID=452637 RepID=B1ZUA5_OPITP|nr:hypothetical protein [Opitutus terrae]ACB76667.1 hypothetical protein Oter_3390 [Opitutus terrae PB90-1]
MKTPKTLVFVLVALVAFAAGLLGSTFSPTSSRPLPPLSSADREALVIQLRSWADNTDWWAEMYAITPNELAYWHGQKIGLLNAADLLERYTPPAQPQSR